MSEIHCPTCICGRRAPVQRSERCGKGPGTISWTEHLMVWGRYDLKYSSGQTADRIAERGGFSYGEIVELTGKEPTTWEPRG
jgi:hypothetical protein